MLTVQPIRYVADVEASRKFYEGLGLELDADSRFKFWAQLRADHGAVGIHDAAVSKGQQTRYRRASACYRRKARGRGSAAGG